MDLKLLTLGALTALALTGAAFAQSPAPATSTEQFSRHAGRRDMLQGMTESLNLTPDQQAKIQPILDQARPQMEQIHREAMEKSRQVMTDAMGKIRPFLTTEQQQKLDSEKNNWRGRHGRRHRANAAEDDSDDND